MTKKYDIALVVGTRPNFVKAAPLLNNIEEQNKIAADIAKLSDDIENNEKEIKAEREKLKKLQDFKKVKDDFNRETTIISNDLKENADKENSANIKRIEAEAKVAADDAAKKKADEDLKKKADAKARAEADAKEAESSNPGAKTAPVGGKKTRNNGRTYLKKTRRKRV